MSMEYGTAPWDEKGIDSENKPKPYCEVQAILLAHYSTYDIHPLLQKDNTGKEKAKFLLPFGNEPIITYPLRLLEIHGFHDITVVITEEYMEEINDFIAQYKHYSDGRDNYSSINIQSVTVNEEDLGEIQVLKQIHKYIKTDFLIIRCDIFTNAPLRDLLTIHRREMSSVTLLLSKQSKQPKQHKKHKKISKNSHIIGTDRKYHKQLILKGHPKEIERLWYMKARADLEDDDENADKHKHDEPQLILNKMLLDHIPHIRFTTKFKLQQIGIFANWILLWILEDIPNDFELLYEEAVPHLIDLQITSKEIYYGIGSGDDAASMNTNDSNNNNNKGTVYNFPDLIRRSSQIKDVKASPIINNNNDDNTENEMEQKVSSKLRKQHSHYTSGLFLSHGDVLGTDYMKTANASTSSLPRALIMKNMNNFRSETMLKTFDDAKSDITAISMSAISTAVNAPITPRTAITSTTMTNEMDRNDNNNNNNNDNTLSVPRKSSPLSQHINSLPSPGHLATIDDTPKMTKQSLVKQQSHYMSDDDVDKLKVFGYVYEEDNDNGLFSCIINNSDCYLSLSLSLINSVIKFEEKQQQKQRQKMGQNRDNKRGKGKKGKNRGNQQQQKQQEMMMMMSRNEEKEEFMAMREYEDNGLLHLIINNNAINECKENNNLSIIKNGCIISPNCNIGDKTRIDKCILAPFVNIGKNCKIINCVILKHVTIGDQCKISNTIISSYTNIGDKSIIHNCKIADRANISKQSILKNETLQSGTINDYDNNNNNIINTNDDTNNPGVNNKKNNNIVNID